MNVSDDELVVCAVALNSEASHLSAGYRHQKSSILWGWYPMLWQGALFRGLLRYSDTLPTSSFREAYRPWLSILDGFSVSS